MDSKLDAPTRAAPIRQAEPTDTRHAIRREDAPDHNNNRREQPPRPEPEDQWEDVTIVSIAALRVFLTQLLTDSGQLLTVPQPARPDTYTHTPAAARAAQAYGGPARTTPPPTTRQNTTTLSPGEIEEIHHLNNLLDRLTARNITDLRIIKSGRFLQSLTTAATEALNN